MSKIYTVGKVKQLIDLNGDSVNFSVKFLVRSRNKEPFDMVVVNQTTLDNSPKLEYQHVEDGEISGDLLWDKNEYQNHFLILRADSPCECEVQIDKKDVKKEVQLPSPTVISPPLKNQGGMNWGKIFLILAIIVGGFALYWFILRKPAVAEPIALSSHHSTAENTGNSPEPESGLLRRLKNLNVS